MTGILRKWSGKRTPMSTWISSSSSRICSGVWTMRVPSCPEGNLAFVGGGPGREAGDVEVELLHVLYVLQRHPPGHLAVGDQLPWRLVDVDVAVHDEDVLEPLLALSLPGYGLCHALSSRRWLDSMPG